ncbi:MAG: ribonuclease P protein component [Patescibacteria group bacterium]|nr:ribonuclease P protein component [Patescibacteria group bacterium]
MRLSQRKDFLLVKRRGQILNTPLFTLSYLKRNQALSFGIRFGFIISKGISKRAVKRNRVRRRVCEAVRLWLKSQPEPLSKSSVDVVFIMRGRSLNAGYEEFSTLVNSVLPKVLES